LASLSRKAEVRLGILYISDSHPSMRHRFIADLRGWQLTATTAIVGKHRHFP
jgi:hypothetical protein